MTRPGDRGTFRVGFTGAREGCTPQQLEFLEQELAALHARAAGNDLVPWFLHGDCEGADSQAAEIAHRVGFVCAALPGHDRHGQMPSRAWTTFNAWVAEPAPYLVRDREIVWYADVILAIAGPRFKSPRSGTGTTVRYARAAGVRTLIAHMDGLIETHDGRGTIHQDKEG